MRWLLFVLVGCASRPATEAHPVFGAPNAKEVPRGDIYFDCDAAPGHFSTWSRRVGPSGAVTGQVYIAATYDDDRWRPLASVAIGGPAPAARAGFDIQVDDGGSTLRVRAVAARTSPSGFQLARSPFGRAPIGGAAFTLRWEGRAVRVEIGGQKGGGITIPLGFAPDRVWLSCSTGEAVFYSVTITSP